MRIVGGEWGGRRIAAPGGRETRPTTDRVREAWMSVVGDRLADARVLDLFAGSGALGLEALSRGAAHATFVERASPAIAVLRQNVAALGAEARTAVVRADALRYATGAQPDTFDVAFADPPYGQGLAAQLVAAFLETPFAALLCVEHRRDDELPPDDRATSRRYGDTVLTFVSADA